MRAAKFGAPPAPGVPPSLPRRVLDLLTTGTAFVLLAPLLAAVALLVTMTSPGPVVFRQERVGQGGVPFTLLKFRTMRTGSRGPNVTTADDHRLTPFGRLLRLAGLDELPQLFNILKGEMTLVGPRPETPDLAMRSPYQDLEEYYLRVVVPTKVAVDLEFLAAPTLPRTLGVIAETLLYIVTGGRTHRTVPIAATAEAQPGRTSSALSS